RRERGDRRGLQLEMPLVRRLVVPDPRLRTVLLHSLREPLERNAADLADSALVGVPGTALLRGVRPTDVSMYAAGRRVEKARNRPVSRRTVEREDRSVGGRRSCRPAPGGARDSIRTGSFHPFPWYVRHAGRLLCYAPG